MLVRKPSCFKRHKRTHVPHHERRDTHIFTFGLGVGPSFGGVRFSPAALFANGEPGFWAETYNPDSLVQRRNLLTWTEDFSNVAWGKVAVTPTLNTTIAPDGTLTADTLTADGTASPHAITYVSITTNPAQKTASLHFKAGTGNFVQLLFDGNTTGWANFDLSNGTVSVQGNGVTAAITAATNGFYRCSLFDSLGTATGMRVAIVSGAAATRYESNSLALSVIAWGGQFELSAITAYQKVTDWNTEYLAAAGTRVHMWQDTARTVPVTAVEQTVGCWDDLSPNGKHATQASSGSRPKLSARYNLLTKSERFSDAAWTRSAILSVTENADGVGDLIVPDTTAGFHYVQQSVVVTGASTTFMVRAKAGGYGWIAVLIGTITTYFDVSTGAVGTTGVGATASIAAASGASGYFDCTVVLANPANSFARVYVSAADNGASFTPNGVSGVYLARADVRLTNDAALSQPTYQRVNTATDYDTAGFIHYLQFDGLDDSLQTGNIDFSGVNKMTVWAGVTKLSDAAVTILCELTAIASSTDGGFYIAAPDTAAAANYGLGLRGSVSNFRQRLTPFAAAASSVLAVKFDTAAVTQATQVMPRVDGTTPAITNVDPVTGAGNYANAALNLGRRNNVSLPFNGRITSVTVRGSSTPTDIGLIRQTEQYSARLAGQSFVST